MSEQTVSSTDLAVVFVRLLDEGVDVWRPGPARRLSEATFRLDAAPKPEDEVWSFQPGDIVVAEHRAEDGKVSNDLFAVARASHFDERFQASLSLVG